MTRSIAITLVLAAFALLSACHAGENNTGRAYAPDMYYSKAYEPYYPSEVTESGMSAILPAENTIAYGTSMDAMDLPPWPFPNVGTGDTASIMPAMRAYENPVEPTEKALARGAYNYRIYCGICHGGQLNGKGYLVTGTKYGQAPANLMDDRLINGASDGWYYHVLQYGINAMGQYQYAMTREERWEVIHYIRKRQQEYLAEQAAEDAAAPVDSAPAETEGEEATEGNDAMADATN
jgi:mono/diheme cytochrome c family protein